MRFEQINGPVPRWSRVRLALTMAMMSLGLAACEGDDGARGAAGQDGMDGMAGADGQDGQPAFSPATVFVASNSGDGDRSVRVRAEDLGLLNQYDTGANEGVLVDAAHRLVQAGDIDSIGTLVTACNAVTRSSDGPRYALGGASTTLATPKGIAAMPAQGLLLVANTGASNLLLFGAAASGDVAPVATVPLPTHAWDLVYDAGTDRLFVALVNGSVAVFDHFGADFGAAGAARSFSIEDETGAASVNLHGIDYDAGGDRLLLSDVGLASSPDDGKLYLIDNASTASGVVVATTTWQGPNTRLGNPVDLQLDGSDVRIAEKANGGGALLIYRNVFEAAGGDVAAEVVFDTPAPESVAVMPEMAPKPGATDLTNPTTPYRLVSTSNPALGSETSGRVYATPRTLGSAPVAVFDSGVASAESITLDRAGNAYMSFDDGSTENSGIAIVGALGSHAEFSNQRDRVIMGANTRLMSPKGVELADGLGLLVVAEQAGAEILLFSACDSGDATPIQVSTGDVAPWDSDYDPSGDTLYVALTNGTVAAYDHFSLALGADGPDRVIVPTQGGAPMAAPTNLHGIRYDQRSDTLIVSDVGSGAVSTDGALMTIPFAATASGEVEIGTRIAGPASLLGNPVDIAFDGEDLYVAEKANLGGRLLVWRDFLDDSTLVGDAAPSDSLDAPAIESLVLDIRH